MRRIRFLKLLIVPIAIVLFGLAWAMISGGERKAAEELIKIQLARFLEEMQKA